MPDISLTSNPRIPSSQPDHQGIDHWNISCWQSIGIMYQQPTHHYVQGASSTLGSVTDLEPMTVKRTIVPLLHRSTLFGPGYWLIPLVGSQFDPTVRVNGSLEIIRWLWSDCKGCRLYHNYWLPLTSVQIRSQSWVASPTSLTRWVRFNSSSVGFVPEKFI